MKQDEIVLAANVGLKEDVILKLCSAGTVRTIIVWITILIDLFSYFSVFQVREARLLFADLLWKYGVLFIWLFIIYDYRQSG